MIKIALIVVLLVIFFQDIKHKAVYWFLFPIVFIFGLFIQWETIGLDLLFNLLFITVLMSLLSLYLSIKNQRLINPLDGFFALGDVLFLIAITPFFFLHTFILFFTSGFLFVLGLHSVLFFFIFWTINE